ncbi:MAG: PTS lactose transporter subunit IIB [Clostridia bacterium BRH_c25]|nr:MAG: PTS lactose transporter subunit IIB [Clostridia bacterium BRH_c25]
MTIITVCGMGFGTSLMLKMTIDDILAENKIKAEVSAWDLGSVKGRHADLFVASEDMKSNLTDIGANIIFIKNLTDTEEVRGKILKAVKQLQ